MAEEKITPEAEEVKAEEVKAEVPAEEKKEEKKAPKEKKGGSKLPIIIGAIAAVLVIAVVVGTFVMGSLATSAYNKKDYEGAYNNSKLALFMSAANKNLIAKTYVQKKLCAEGKYFTAAEVLENSKMTEEEKAKVYASDNNLAFCKKGSIVTFGKYETDNNAANGTEAVEWIVLDVIKENGKARALLMTKDIVDNPGGWNKFVDGNTSYAESNLQDFCEDFLTSLTMSDITLGQKIVSVNVSTADSSTKVDSGEDFTAKAYAPAKEELDKYLTGDLAQYIKACPTASAKANGVTAYGKDKTGVYYLRNIGNFENNAQWASGINKDGVFQEGFAMSGSSTGARVCINVDLGAY